MSPFAARTSRPDLSLSAPAPALAAGGQNAPACPQPACRQVSGDPGPGAPSSLRIRAATFPTKGQGGFSLIEILVAFAIFSLVAGAALSALSSGLRLADASRERGEALLLAESIMALAGNEIPLQSGGASGQAENGMSWELAFTELPENREPPPRLKAWLVEVLVSWGSDRRPAELYLQTVRLSTDEE